MVVSLDIYSHIAAYSIDNILSIEQVSQADFNFKKHVIMESMLMCNSIYVNICVLHTNTVFVDR